MYIYVNACVRMTEAQREKVKRQCLMLQYVIIHFFVISVYINVTVNPNFYMIMNAKLVHAD